MGFEWFYGLPPRSDDMLELDGSAGGGQLVRSALSASVLTGRGFVLDGVRVDRPEPGLRPQHLAAVDLAASVCDATVEGAAPGSETLRFEPGPVSGGEVAVEVGTAGSLTLLVDVALPLAARLDDPLVVTLGGGTDVAWSPPLDYLRRVKLPLLRRHGLVAALDVDRRGFYPAGGGRLRLAVAPSDLRPLSLAARPTVTGLRVHSTATADLADAEVAERQAAAAVESLAAAAPDRPVVERTVASVDAVSTGSAVVVRADARLDPGREAADSVPVAGFDALGERGRPAEDVGSAAADSCLEWLAGEPAVDAHLADQLLVFLGLAGGRVLAPALTDHVASNRDLLAAFGLDVDVAERADGRVRLVG